MAELKNHDTSLRSLSGDGWNVGPVNLREFQVLTALSELGESNPRQVRLIVQNWAERTDIVDILLTLDRLVIKRKFVEHRLVAVEGKSGRLLYRMTDEGDRALRRAREEGKSLYEWADCKDGAAERIR